MLQGNVSYLWVENVHSGYEFEPDCQWLKISTIRNAALDRLSDITVTV